MLRQRFTDKHGEGVRFMKRVVKILSGILAFLTLVFGICLLLTAIGWPVSTERIQTLVGSLRRMPQVLFLVLAAFALIAIAVAVLYGMIGEHFNRRKSALLEKNALGETCVSFSTLSQIAERAVKNRSDIASCKTKVSAIGNSVRIDVRVVSAPTVSLLELTHALQDSIASAILASCGMTVGTVNVTVDQADIRSGKA